LYTIAPQNKKMETLISKKKRKSKLIHLDADVIKSVTLQAIHNGTVFKLFVEDMIIKQSKKQHGK